MYQKAVCKVVWHWCDLDIVNATTPGVLDANNALRVPSPYEILADDEVSKRHIVSSTDGIDGVCRRPENLMLGFKSDTKYGASSMRPTPYDYACYEGAALRIPGQDAVASS